MKIEILGNELIDGIRDVRDVTKCGDISTIEVDAISDDLIVVRRVYFDGASVQIRVRGKVHETGCASVVCRDLLQALSPFGRQCVTLSTDKALYAFVTCDGCRVKLEVSPAVTSIVPASGKCPRGVFAADDLTPAVVAVRHAMSEDPTRRILEGVQIEVGTDMKLRAVATDGRRLAVAEVQLTRAEFPSASYSTSLPRAAVEFLMRGAPSGDDVEICDFKKDYVQVEIGNSVGIFERPAATFPDWRQCVPKDPPFRAHFGLGLGTALANGIKALDIHQDEVDEEGEPAETTFVAHILTPKGSDLADVRVTRCGDDVPSFTTSTGFTAADYFETHVNARYLLEAIQNHLDVDIYADKIGTGPSPLVLKFPRVAWFYEVLMPIRMS